MRAGHTWVHPGILRIMQPDIQPQRVSAIDVASLAPIEAYAVLVHVAGHDDPVVTEALLDAMHRVLRRTRGGEE